MGEKLQLINGKVMKSGIEFRYQDVYISDGSITQIADADQRPADVNAKTAIDCEGGYILPGFIDLDCSEGKNAQYLLLRGTTGYVSSLHLTENFADDLMRYGELTREESVKEAQCLGVRMQGPISLEAMGGDPEEAASIIEDLVRCSDGALKFLDVRPGEKGAAQIIKTFRSDMSVGLLGEDASYEEARGAMALGAVRLKDSLSSLADITSEEPGAFPAVLDTPNVYVEVSADREHVHPSILRMLYRILPPERIILTGALAPESRSLYDIVRIALEDGVPLPYVIRSVTESPAKLLGLEDRLGRVKEGYEADLIILDLHTLEIRTVIRKGIVIYNSGKHTMYGG